MAKINFNARDYRHTNVVISAIANTYPRRLLEAERWCFAKDKKPMVFEDGTLKPLTKLNRHCLVDFDELSCQAFSVDFLPGFYLQEGDNLTVLDLDNKTGDRDIAQLMEQRVYGLRSFAEKSCSGKGYHIFVEGEIGGGIKDTCKALEAYSQDRFMVCTGQVVDPAWPVRADNGIPQLLDAMRQAIAERGSYEGLTNEPPLLETQEIIRRLEGQAHWSDAVNAMWHNFNLQGMSEIDACVMGHIVYYTGNFEQAFELMQETSLLNFKVRYKNDPQALNSNAKRREWESLPNVVRKMKMLFSRMRNKAVEANEILTSKEAPPSKPVISNLFDKFNLVNVMDKIEQRIGRQRYLDANNEILAYGQHTVLVAPPNAGKTLFILSVLKLAGEAGVDLSKCYYINADDGDQGSMDKSRIAAQAGFKTISPGLVMPNGETITVKEVMSNIDYLINTGEAEGSFVILDTLKKFVDYMDKKDQSATYEKLRQFCMCGGGVVSLTHTNKNRNADGKLVMAGTADLAQDAQCIYFLDVEHDVELGFDVTTVTVDKIRASVKAKLAFKFLAKSKRTRYTSYMDVFNSVQFINTEDLNSNKARNHIAQQEIEDADKIEVIKHVISRYEERKVKPSLLALRDECSRIGPDEFGVFCGKLKWVEYIKRYSFDNKTGHTCHWYVTRNPMNNAMMYSLN